MSDILKRIRLTEESGKKAYLNIRCSYICVMYSTVLHWTWKVPLSFFLGVEWIPKLLMTLNFVSIVTCSLDRRFCSFGHCLSEIHRTQMGSMWRQKTKKVKCTHTEKKKQQQTDHIESVNSQVFYRWKTSFQVVLRKRLIQHNDSTSLKIQVLALRHCITYLVEKNFFFVHIFFSNNSPCYQPVFAYYSMWHKYWTITFKRLWVNILRL